MLNLCFNLSSESFADVAIFGDPSPDILFLFFCAFFTRNYEKSDNDNLFAETPLDRFAILI